MQAPFIILQPALANCRPKLSLFAIGFPFPPELSSRSAGLQGCIIFQAKANEST